MTHIHIMTHIATFYDSHFFMTHILFMTPILLMTHHSLHHSPLAKMAGTAAVLPVMLMRIRSAWTHRSTGPGRGGWGNTRHLYRAPTQPGYCKGKEIFAPFE